MVNFLCLGGLVWSGLCLRGRYRLSAMCQEGKYGGVTNALEVAGKGNVPELVYLGKCRTEEGEGEGSRGGVDGRLEGLELTINDGT